MTPAAIRQSDFAFKTAEAEFTRPQVWPGLGRTGIEIPQYLQSGPGASALRLVLRGLP